MSFPLNYGGNLGGSYFDRMNQAADGLLDHIEQFDTDGQEGLSIRELKNVDFLQPLHRDLRTQQDWTRLHRALDFNGDNKVTADELAMLGMAMDGAHGRVDGRITRSEAEKMSDKLARMLEGGIRNLRTFLDQNTPEGFERTVRERQADRVYNDDDRYDDEEDYEGERGDGLPDDIPFESGAAFINLAAGRRNLLNFNSAGASKRDLVETARLLLEGDPDVEADLEEGLAEWGTELARHRGEASAARAVANVRKEMLRMAQSVLDGDFDAYTDDDGHLSMREFEDAAGASGSPTVFNRRDKEAIYGRSSRERTEDIREKILDGDLSAEEIADIGLELDRNPEIIQDLIDPDFVKNLTPSQLTAWAKALGDAGIHDKDGNGNGLATFIRENRNASNPRMRAANALMREMRKAWEVSADGRSSGYDNHERYGREARAITNFLRDMDRTSGHYRA